MFVALNLNNRKNSEGKYYVSPEKQFWFSDKNFRAAIDYAIDRKNMVQNIANGLAKPLFTAESLNSVFLNKNIKGKGRFSFSWWKKYIRKLELKRKFNNEKLIH